MALDIASLGAVADLAKTAIQTIWPDKSEQEKTELAAAVGVVQGQLAINAAEATSPSLFAAGWRPFIGWTCGGALFSQYILRPWVQWVCAVSGHPVPPIPGIDDQLWQLMGTMLGMGGLRTFEKIKGKA